MNTFCTIISADYIFFAQALYESIERNGVPISFHVLVSNAFSEENRIEASHPNIHFTYIDEVCSEELGASIYQKYYAEMGSMDRFRWSMKPVFLKFLLEEKRYDKVIFLDPDIFFYNNWEFLFDELTNHNILLSPHWRSQNWKNDAVNFRLLFVDGFCNGGFVGASKGGIEPLRWWAECCLWECTKNYSKGLYDDQRYLDLLPFHFEKVKILRHQGCNIAEWNRIECRRTVKDSEVLINDKFKIIFIHFNKLTVNNIWHLEDQLLKPYLKSYFSTLKKYNLKFDPKKKFPKIRPILKYRLIEFLVSILSIQPFRTGLKLLAPKYYKLLLAREKRFRILIQPSLSTANNI